MGKEKPSLKSAVTRASVQTAILTALIAMIASFVYYSAARMVAKRTVFDEIKQNVVHDAEQILPSFLLPEQKEALPAQLERIRRNSNLSKALTLDSPSELPMNFKNCLPQNTPNYCLSSDKSEVGVVFPVSSGSRILSYLLEARSINGSYTFETVAATAATSAIIIAIFVFILFSLFHKITGKSVPHDIDQLLKYIQRLLLEKSVAKKPDLAFSDFSSLQDGIATIFNNYKRTQNQAIVGNFSAGVLHDIKTQLQSIVTASELVSEAKADKSKYSSRLENLQMVLEKNLPELQEIINSTLDANKEIILNPQMTDIETTIKTSIDNAKVQVKFREIEVEIRAPKQKVVIRHDRVQAIRLFLNLIKNAFEAQNKKDDKSKKVLINITDTQEEIHVRIEDAGPGIKTNIEKIFDPFVTTKKHGIGLGLFNVQKIVVAHGWNIAAKSSENLGGACFEVTMPKEINL